MASAAKAAGSIASRFKDKPPLSLKDVRRARRFPACADQPRSSCSGSACCVSTAMCSRFPAVSPTIWRIAVPFNYLRADTKPSDREEVRQWARGEIERNRNETDGEKIGHLLNYGSQQLHSLRGAVVNSTSPRTDIRGPSQAKGSCGHDH